MPRDGAPRPSVVPASIVPTKWPVMWSPLQACPPWCPEPSDWSRWDSRRWRSTWGGLFAVSPRSKSGVRVRKFWVQERRKNRFRVSGFGPHFRDQIPAPNLGPPIVDMQEGPETGAKMWAHFWGRFFPEMRPGPGRDSAGPRALGALRPGVRSRGPIPARGPGIRPGDGSRGPSPGPQAGVRPGVRLKVPSRGPIPGPARGAGSRGPSRDTSRGPTRDRIPGSAPGIRSRGPLPRSVPVRNKPTPAAPHPRPDPGPGLPPYPFPTPLPGPLGTGRPWAQGPDRGPSQYPSPGANPEPLARNEMGGRDAPPIMLTHRQVSRARQRAHTMRTRSREPLAQELPN